MATKTKTAVAQLEELAANREQTYEQVQKLKKDRDEYENTTEAMRGELIARRTTHPWEHEKDGTTIKPDTETAVLQVKIKERMAEPWPGQRDFDEAVRTYQEAETAEHHFKLGHKDQLTAEITAPATEAEARIREGWRLILEGTAIYTATQESLRALIVSTSPLNGQHLAYDPVIHEWTRQAEDAIDRDIMAPRISDAGCAQVDQALAAMENS